MIIFVKPRFYYKSYDDFWSLVEMSNFDWCWMDEINLRSNHTYIVSMVDPKRDKWQLSWWQRKRKRGRLIFWDLERPMPRLGIEKHKQFLDSLGFDEIWHSDPKLAKDLKTRFVILGSDERLAKTFIWERPYNFALMAYLNDRRKEIVKDIVGVAPGYWGVGRQMVLEAARFGLNIHQDDDLYYEPLRFALFAAYGLPIISEVVYDGFPLDWGLLQCNYNRLVEYCNFLASNYRNSEDYYKALGNHNKRKLCYDYRFRGVVEYVARN